MEKVIKIPSELTSAIEVAQYDYNSYRDIIVYMLSSTNYDTDTKAFKNYNELSKKAYVAYETLKRQLQDEYIVPVCGNNIVNWNLNFDSSEVTVNYYE